MKLPPFTLHRPTSSAEVSALVVRHGDACDLVAGGTDLLPNYKFRLNPKAAVISLDAVGELRSLDRRWMGAGVTLERIERHEAFTGPWSILADCAASISSPPLRAMGTLGGNLLLDTRCWFFNQSPVWRESKGYCLKAEGDQCLVIPNSSGKCYATYSGEMAAALLVMRGRVVLMSVRGERELDLDDLYGTDGIVRFGDRKPDEWVLGVRLPDPHPEARGAYRKLRQRDSIDFPSLGVAVWVRVAGGRVEELGLATTAMVARPERFDTIAASFVGELADGKLAERIGAALAKVARCYRNVPLDPAYRKKMVAVLCRRALADAHPSFRPS